MDIREHLSAKDIERLNQLAKSMRKSWWWGLITPAFLVVWSVEQFLTGIVIAHRYGIHRLADVLALYFGQVGIDRTYQGYEIWIANRGPNITLALVVAALVLMFRFTSRWKDRCFLKLWKLVSSDRASEL